MKIKLAMPVIFAAFVLAACGNSGDSQKQESQEKTEVQQVQKTDVLGTREGLEAMLKDFGSPLCQGAKFSEFKQSNSTCEGGHSITYDVPEYSGAAKQKVADFYTGVFKKLESEGWKSKMDRTPAFDYWYRKGKDDLIFKQSFAGDYKIHTVIFTVCEN